MCDYQSDSLKGMSVHITKKHNHKLIEQFYIDNINDTPPVCIYCGEKSKFISLIPFFENELFKCLLNISPTFKKIC